MKKSAKTLFLLIILALIIAVGADRLIPRKLRTPAPATSNVITAPPSSTPGNSIINQLTDNNMKLTSPAFSDNGILPEKYGCRGADTNPPLEISGLPAGAKSLTLIIDDPDAPSGSFIHWLVFNIDPTAAAIAENSVPSGAIVGLNGFGAANYGGPCPPSGTHHYVFNLYALDTVLNLKTGSDASKIISAMDGHVLGKTILTGAYSHN